MFFFPNNEQAEFGKHLAVLPSLPDLHRSPSSPAGLLVPRASASIHQVSVRLLPHRVRNEVQGEVDDGKRRPPELS